MPPSMTNLQDWLTDLCLRRLSIVQIAQSVRSGKSFSILYLDLDHFKDVNDTRGHLTGDRLLRW